MVLKDILETVAAAERDIAKYSGKPSLTITFYYTSAIYTNAFDEEDKVHINRWLDGCASDIAKVKAANPRQSSDSTPVGYVDFG